ncbi:MAG: TonB-dependent receptor [Candidatus Omnitrophota bacterium]
MKRLFLLFLICIIVINFQGNIVNAEDAKSGRDVFDLGKIVVTPSRLYQEYGQVSRATNLITEDEIQDKNPLRAGDLLEDLPSAHVMEYGSLGQSSTVSFRGATASQTLVLIDDMPINNPRDGQVNLSDIEGENIDRIEVVRGPSSSLYGSSAVGATVNIITKNGKTEVPETTITNRFGTYRTHLHEVANSAKIKGFNYFLSASSANSEGHRDNSAYHAQSYNGNIGYEFGKAHSIKIGGRYHSSEVGTPGSLAFFDADDKQESFQDYVNAVWETRYDDKFQIKVHGYANLDRLEFVEAAYPMLEKTAHQTKNRAVNIQSSYTMFEDYTIMAGIEGKEHLLNSSFAGKHDYISRSTYGLLDINLFDEAIDIIGGARYDDYSTFGSQVSPSLNCSIKNGPWKLRGLFGESYRAPTFNDLYWPTEEWIPAAWSFLWPEYGRGAMGDQNLNPEKGKTYEAGIENIMDFSVFDEFPLDTKTGITFFRTDMEDLINWAIDNSDFYWKPMNVNEAKIEGLEVEAEVFFIKDVRAVANYTQMRAKDKETKRYLNYRPKHRFDFSLSYSHPWGVKGRFRSQYSSKTYSDEQNNIQVKPYWVFGTDLYYDIDDNTRYFINIDNIFNRTYEKAKGYPQPGFTIMLGIKTRFP